MLLLTISLLETRGTALLALALLAHALRQARPAAARLPLEVSS